MPQATDQPATHGRSLTGFYIGVGVVAALVGLGVWQWTPMKVSYHAQSLRKLRTATATDALGRHFPADHLLEADGHFRELFGLGAVREGMSYDEVTGILGKPDNIVRHPDRGARACKWNTSADDGCYEGYIVIFGPDDRADFVPHRRREGERGDVEA